VPFEAFNDVTPPPSCDEKEAMEFSGCRCTPQKWTGAVTQTPDPYKVDV